MSAMWEYLCEIKKGYSHTFFQGSHVLLVHPGHAPYLIPLSTIKKGDVLPRDTDDQFIVPFDPRRIHADVPRTIN